MITQHASGKEICPVKAWSLLVVRILNYDLGNLESPVNTYVHKENSAVQSYLHDKHKMRTIPSKDITHVAKYLHTNKNKRTIQSKKIKTHVSTVSAKDIATHIHDTVENIGVNILGFRGNETGTHSVRTSFAMLLYLQRVHPFTIMLQGRWSSEAFLLYVRRQVQQFSTGLSASMTQENFFTIPEHVSLNGEGENSINLTQPQIGSHNNRSHRT